LFLGRIARIKQLNNIVDACAQSKKFIESDYKFIIAGPKDNASWGYFEEIVQSIERKKLQEKVIFNGSINSPQKEVLLAESRALFLVSKSENFGNVVIEALQQGTPVVASKGTPWESLNDKGSGLWVESAPTELAKALDYFIEMDELRYQEMCSNALDFSKQFQKENSIQNWARFLNE
jgi:glycosyltransferase involved in cell wall biosynthesis